MSWPRAWRPSAPPRKRPSGPRATKKSGAGAKRKSGFVAPRKRKRRALREDQLRLQEAERRARVEADMQLQQERMRLEVHARAKNSPVKAVVGVSLVIIAVAGGLGYKMYQQHQAELAAKRAQLALVEQQKAALEAATAKARGRVQDPDRRHPERDEQQAGPRHQRRRAGPNPRGGQPAGAGGPQQAQRHHRRQEQRRRVVVGARTRSRRPASTTSATTRSKGCKTPVHVDWNGAVRTEPAAAAGVAAPAFVRTARGHAGVRRRRATSTSTASSRC